jgi:site-specific recombinase XerD
VVELKVTDVDSANVQVLVSRGKGKKDRYINLPESALGEMRDYYRECKSVKSEEEIEHKR